MVAILSLWLATIATNCVLVNGQVASPLVNPDSVQKPALNEDGSPCERAVSECDENSHRILLTYYIVYSFSI
jgi:hypothetical protein